MDSFRGTYTYQIDEKGRLALPKPFRLITGIKRKGGKAPNLVLTRGFNGCVAAYTESGWQPVEDKLNAASFTSQGTRDFFLELASTLSIVPIDGMGRILIPQVHMEMGGFKVKREGSTRAATSEGGEQHKENEVRLVGFFDHIEMWQPQRLIEHQKKAKGTYEDRAQKFFGDGL